MRLGVIGHRGYPQLADLLRTLAERAKALGLELYLESELHATWGNGDRLEEPGQIDALITFGGDGTLLRGARFVDGHEVPILGINLGRLGFLTACGPDEFDSVLTRLAAGDFRSEARMRLDGRVRDRHGTERHRWSATNDVVLHKGGFARVVQLAVTVNGELIASYAADGLVACTPTGSTAYSLSAGGPVVVPTVESIILTAISPHTLAIRPVVLPPTAVVEVQALNDGVEELLVTVDGQVGTTFGPGETLIVERGTKPVLLVRFPGTTFFERMRRKLGWGGLSDRGEKMGC